MTATPRYHVFLSYHEQDETAAKLIAERLRTEQGFEPWLRAWSAIPGRLSQAEQERGLAESTACAVLIGAAGVRQWQQLDVYAAISQRVEAEGGNFPVIPVFLPGCPAEAQQAIPATLRLYEPVSMTALDDEPALQRLAAGVRGEPALSASITLPDEPAPYRGLLPFEAEHARFFFGRDDDVRRLVEKLRQQRFVAVVGASGSGKSSLVMAGLLPKLAQNVLPDSVRWKVLQMTPGSEPLRSLANQLATLAAPNANRLQEVDALTERLQTEREGFRTALTAYVAGAPRPLLLFVDQFEELFTQCQDGPERCRAQAEQFVANLADTVQQGGGQVCVLITLRADFLDRCLALPNLPGLLEDHQVLLGPMGEPALREAIMRPAQAVEALFEKGLVEIILRDVVSEPGRLPLLQQTLYELWLRRQGPWLTLTAYQESGGVLTALQQRADHTYHSLPPHQQEIARNIFVRLTALSEGASDARLRVPRREIYPANVDPMQVDSVIQLLSGSQTRLVIADESTVEIAHEALILHWQMLRKWISESRDEFIMMRQLTLASNDWNARGRESSYLFLGSRLANVVLSADRNRNMLNRLEQEFLAASLNLQNQQESLLIDKGKLDWNLVDHALATADTQTVRLYFRTALRYGPERVDRIDLLREYLTRMWSIIAESSFYATHDDLGNAVRPPSHVQYLVDVLEDTSYSPHVRKWAAETSRLLPALDESLRLLLESMVFTSSETAENKDVGLGLAFAALDSLTRHDAHAIDSVVERVKAMSIRSKLGYQARMRLGSLLGTISAHDTIEAQSPLSSRHSDPLIWITSVGATMAQITISLLTDAAWIWKEVAISWIYAATVLMAGFLTQRLFVEPLAVLPSLALGAVCGLMLYYMPLRRNLIEAMSLDDDLRQHPPNWIDWVENLDEIDDGFALIFFPITTILARTGLARIPDIGRDSEAHIKESLQSIAASYRGQTTSESLILYIVGGAAVVAAVLPGMHLFALFIAVILGELHLIFATPKFVRLASSPLMRVPKLILVATWLITEVMFEIALLAMNLVAALLAILFYIPLRVRPSVTGVTRRLRWRLTGSVVLLLITSLYLSSSNVLGLAIALWFAGVSVCLFAVDKRHIHLDQLQYVLIGAVAAFGIGLVAKIPLAQLLMYSMTGGALLVRMASSKKQDGVYG